MATEELHLEQMQRVDVRVSQRDGVAKGCVRREKLAAAFCSKNSLFGDLVGREQLKAQRGDLFWNEHLVVVARHFAVRLRQRHFDEVEVRSKKAPTGTHRFEVFAPFVRGEFGGERRPNSEPARQHEARLHPCEYPGDRAERGDVLRGFAACGPRPDLQVSELVGGRGRAKVGNEPRVVADDGSVRARGACGHAVHRGTPARLDGFGRLQRGFKSGVHVKLERAASEGRKSEFCLDHFALHRDAQATVDRACGLSEERAVDRTAAATDRAAASMKECKVHAGAFADGDERFLRAVKGPRRTEHPCVFRGVRVADHDLLPVTDRCTIGFRRENSLGDNRCRIKVRKGLEEGHHTKRLAHSALALKQKREQHIGRRTRCRDDVRAEGPTRKRRDHAKGAEDVANRFVLLEVSREEWALRCELRFEERHALVFGPGGVGSEAQMLGNGIHRCGVHVARLAQVETRKTEAEDLCAADDVEQHSFGDACGTCFMERAPQHHELVHELGWVGVSCKGSRREGSRRVVCKARLTHARGLLEPTSNALAESPIRRALGANDRVQFL